MRRITSSGTVHLPLVLLLCAAALTRDLQAQSVSVSVTPAGLSSVQYNGIEYLAYGRFGLNAVNMQAPDGTAVAANLQFTSQIDLAHNQIVQNYDWGSVTVTYTGTGNRFQLAITTSNRSSNTITGVFIDALGIHFPSKPQEYDGAIPILGTNLGSPTALRMTYGTGAAVLCNDDVAPPLIVGFPWAYDRPTSTVFPIRINTGHDPMYPDIIPFINRPIPPGGSDTYRISLRFGNATDSTASLAQDVYRAFAAANPPILNWPDRRPIGSLILATSGTGWQTNPRGWLLDPSINVTTPDGILQLRTKILNWADNSVTELKGMNAQGMITWDIEGEQFPQSTSYIGDPRVFASLAPEMAGIADDYFRKFRDAGLRVGVCIRPQQLSFAADLSTASQTAVADPTQLMIDKMTYARNRWGATLFYVDSNGDPNLPLDYNFFRRVAQALPDALIIPEHKNTGYYSATAPYRELRQGYASTDAAVRDIYPGAFSVINTADGPIDARYADLQAAVLGGDVMMFRGWFDDGNNAKIKALYPASVPQQPFVQVVAPGPNAQVSGTVAATATANGQQGIAGVRFTVDHVQIGAQLTASPYTWAWNTAAFANGTHVLSFIVRDSQGLTGTASVTVQVQNASHPPSVSFIAPVNGATVSGTIAITSSPSSVAGVAGIHYLLDNNTLGVEITSAPWSLNWDTTSVSNGQHTLTAVVRDNNGQTANSSINVNVLNSVAPPVVSIVSPAQGATVNGSVMIGANASSPVGIAGVRFLVDGSAVAAEIAASPYTVNWNSTAVINGSHTVTAIARDILGQIASVSVAVNVQNAAPVPTVAITSPAANSSLSGTVMLIASANSAIGIAGVRFLIDNNQVGGEIGSAPFSLSWNSAAVINGTHFLSAVARDLSGATASAQIPFTVANAMVPDTVPPQITLLSPGGNSTVNGTITLAASASDNVGVTGVGFYLDGVLAGDVTVPPYQLQLDSRTTWGGTHYLAATARDAAGNRATSNISFTVGANSPPDCGTFGIRVFVGCYYASTDLTNLALTRIDPDLNFDWAWTSPDPSIPSASYSVVWQGKFLFDGGNYLFELKTQGGARLFVDGASVLDAWTAQGFNDYLVKSGLSSGTHSIRLEYTKAPSAGEAKLGWQLY